MSSEEFYYVQLLNPVPHHLHNDTAPSLALYTYLDNLPVTRYKTAVLYLVEIEMS